MTPDTELASLPEARCSPGFSFLEALIAMAIVLIAMGAALTFVVEFGSAINTETSTLGTQQSARVIVEELTRHIQQVGYNIRRPDAFNPGNWQHSVIYAGSHALVFNADISQEVGWLPSSESVSLPGGATYSGEGLGATTAGAETYVYTIDANANGTFEAADRSAAASGSYNPASQTENPLDFAVFRRVYGYNGTDYGGDLEPLLPYLFTNATTDIQFPDSTTPPPLFTYWISEDLNMDGKLGDEECVNDVIDSCPPLVERAPTLYLWGDSDFDEELSETEKAALRTMEVGSTTWSDNPLLDGGAYKSTTLATAIDPNSASPYLVDVVDGTKLGPGYIVQIGSGNSAERFYVEQVATTPVPDRIMLTSDPTIAHAAGTTVQVLPVTLLRAIRTVGVTYTSITDKKDNIAGGKVAGRLMRQGTNGMEYRVASYHRKVEVINAPTSATTPDIAPSGADVCPLVVVNSCTGTASEQTVRYTSIPGQQQIDFLVTDPLGNIMSDVDVEFTNTDASVGGLASAKLKSNAQGVASVGYTPTGVLGVDTIAAKVSCDSGGATYDATATNELTFYEVTRTLTSDCLSTVTPQTSKPATNFTVLVSSSGGPVSSHEIELGLAFDPAYSPFGVDYSQLVGELILGGTSQGSTDNNGELASVAVTTDGSGEISGSFGLVSDVGGQGARLELVTTLVQPGCSSDVGTLRDKIDFMKLELDSTLPVSGCNELLPCRISASMPAPKVGAQLSMIGQPIQNAPLTFTTNDLTSPSDGTETGASVLLPASGLQTDGSGFGEVTVSNNAAPAISPSTPLVTLVDVTSAGDPLMCSNGAIASASEEAGFEFEAPANVCIAQLTQPLVVKQKDDELCVHIFNDNDVDGCPMDIKGLQFKIYEADGVTPASGNATLIKQIEGGGVSSSASCSTSDRVKIFTNKCKNPDAKLPNGELWMFTNDDECTIPYLSVEPQDYFQIPKIQFENDFPPGRAMDVTVVFECNGDCDTGATDSATFRVQTPY